MEDVGLVVVKLVLEVECGNIGEGEEGEGERVDGGRMGVDDPGLSQGLGGEVRLMVAFKSVFWIVVLN